MTAEPLTFSWRGRTLRVDSDDPTLNLYSTPIGILRRAMGRAEGVTSLELALRSSLGPAYLVHVREHAGEVVVELRHAGRAP